MRYHQSRRDLVLTESRIETKQIKEKDVRELDMKVLARCRADAIARHGKIATE